MKGIASINPTFQPIDSISHPHILSIDPLIVASTRYHAVYFKSERTCLKIEPKTIINGCYSKTYGVIMLLTEDGRLRIYTQNFLQIARIPWQSKYSVGFQFLTNDRMLMIGANQIQLLYVKVHSNIKSTKFVSSMKFNIEKLEKYVVEPSTKLQWNKGFNFDVNNDFLYIWSSKDVNFYSLKKLNLISHIPCLSRKQMAITYVYYNISYKYTITGLINGHIKVWRLPVNIKDHSSARNYQNYTSKDYILIHQYIKHSKGVQKIIEVNFSNNNKQVNNILISSSADLSICFWSLETFQLLRYYDFHGEYSSIFLHNQVYSLSVKQKTLGILQWGKNLQFITDITSKIIAFDKYRPEVSFKKDTEIDSIQLTLGNNVGFQIRDQQLDAKDLNKIELQYIYPPLKAKAICQVISSPYTQNQYYLLVENGQIFKLRMEDNSGKIQQLYQIQKAKDIELHQLNQLPSIIAFLSIIPPEFDSQINDSATQKKQVLQEDSFMQEDEQSKKSKFLDLKLIAVGCQKGAVVFFKIENFENIYARVTYHRQPIVRLEAFTSEGRDYLASCCAENYLKITKFQKVIDKAQCIISIYTGASLTKIIGFQDRLSVVFIKGFFEVYKIASILSDETSKLTKNQLNSGHQLVCHKNLGGNDHQLEIQSIDYDSKNKLILTAGADNKIKIWTYYKVLVYQIYLDEGLKCAIWFRNMEMLISHSSKILYFRNIGLNIDQEELNQENSVIVEEGNIESITKTLAFIKGIENQHKMEKSLVEAKSSRVKQENKKKYQSRTRQRIPSPKSSVTRKKGLQSHMQIIQGNDQFALDLQPHKKNFFGGNIRQKKSIDTSSKPQSKKKRPQSHIQQLEYKPKIPDSDREAMRKHLNEMKDLKKQVNQSILPKIEPKNQDIFDEFMKSKLLNKKVLTRRDITLNRIIMKNIIRDHFGNESDVISNLKLDF